MQPKQLPSVSDMYIVEHDRWWSVDHLIDSSQGRRTSPVHHLWVLSASTSIFTSRYLLDNLNWHYRKTAPTKEIPSHPLTTFIAFHLLSLQLFCSIFLNIGLIERASCHEETTTTTGVDRIQQLLSDLTFTISMPLFIQAISHIPNPPTLLMLSLLAFLPSLLLSFGDSTARPLHSTLRLCVFMIGISAIISDDYRISVPTMALGIPASLLAGLQTILEPSESKDSIQNPRRNIYRAGMCLAVTLLLCAKFEVAKFGLTPMLELDTLDWSAPFVLLVNLVSTTAALCLGGNLVSPLGFEKDVFQNMTRRNNWFSVALSMMVTAFTVASFLLVGPPTRLGWTQISGYGAVVLCIVKPDFTAMAHAISRAPSQARYVLLSIYREMAYGAGPTAEYAALPVTETMDSLDGCNRNDPESYQGTQYHSSSLLRVTCTSILTLTTLTCWIFTIQRAVLGATLPNLPPPNLDTTFTPSTDLEIVISMYKEPMSTVLSTILTLHSVPYIASLNPRITIYTKSESSINSTLAAQLPDKTTMKPLPNIGREGSTYLHHILANWNALAKQTLFVQAELHNEAQLATRLENYLGNDTGMLSLGFSGHSCDLRDGACSDAFGWMDNSGIVPWACSRANGDAASVCERLLLSYKGQFAASAARIRGVDKAVYQELQRLFVDEKSWVHGEAYLKGRPDEMSRPFFGYTVERLWSGLMQCSNERIARDCPTLLGGWRRGGGREDCQCFD